MISRFYIRPVSLEIAYSRPFWGSFWGYYPQIIPILSQLATPKRTVLWWKHVPRPHAGALPWTSLLNRWIKHSQQAMNLDNKISSVRPGTINIELGLYYTIGPKKGRWYLQNRDCTITASRCAQGLKFQVVHLKKCSSFWGTPSPRPPARASPLDPLRDFRPTNPLICPQLHLLDPPLRRMSHKRWESLSMGSNWARAREKYI